MKLKNVFQMPHRQTNKYSKLVCDWLEQGFQLGGDIISGTSIEQLSASASQIPNENRRTLHAVVSRQMMDLNLHAKQIQYLENLKDESSRVVVTAHQPVLFGGPLYIFFKIASAIKLAESLQAKWNISVIPVYWMGTEDHDFEEISSLNVFGKKYQWEAEHSGMTGRVQLDEKFEELLLNIENAAGKGENAEHIIQTLKKIYSRGKTIGQSNKEWIHVLFREFGLLILDPDDVELKTVIKPILHRELSDSVGLHGAQKFEQQLGNQYAAQVFPREINLFYAKENLRARLAPDADDFVVVGTELKFSASDLQQEVNEYPERFSPNVVLRPAYQQSVLPALAFIGGPAEVAYWIQLHGVFEDLQLEFPALVLRDTFLLIPSKAFETWKSLGFEEADFFLEYPHLVARYLERTQSQPLIFTDEREQLQTIRQEIFTKMTQLDKSLGGNVEAEWKKVEAVVEGLESRLKKTLKKKEEDALQKIENLLEKCCPGGGLQERTESGLQYLFLYGTEFIHALVASANPLDRTFKILQIEN